MATSPARGAAPTLAALAFVLGAGTGCDWRQFDTLQGQVPVVKVSAPSGYPAAQDFGQVMIAVSPPSDGSVAARALVSSQGQTGLAAVSFDARGNAVATPVTGTAIDNLAGSPVWAMAEVKGTGKALLGAPGGLKGSLVLLDLDPPYAGTLFVAVSEPQFGVGVAAGALGGGAADDLVALSATTLHVFVDGGTAAPSAYYTDTGAATSCPIFLSASLPQRFRLNRPVLIADLQGALANQIVVGTPSPSVAGTVSIFSVDTTAGTATCALTITAPGGEKAFGESLAVGDFDGDGALDLVVGAPPSHAYFYPGAVLTPAPASTVTKPGGVGFGAAIAAVHVEGEKRDRAYIADPDATVSGQTTAGNVSVYTLDTLGTTMLMPTPAVSVLADRSPSGSEAYGSTVAALPFCTTKTLAPDGGVDGGGADAGAPVDAGPRPDGGGASACRPVTVPLVGSSSTVFAYFTLGAFDPRE